MRVKPETVIAGSPERCLARLVVEAEGRPYLLERIAPDKAERRDGLAGLQFELAARGLPLVVPPIPPRGQDEKLGFLVDLAERGFWQLTPFVEGVEPPRPGYVFEEARGERLGVFLAEMDRIGGHWAEGQESKQGRCEDDRAGHAPGSCAAWSDGQDRRRLERVKRQVACEEPLSLTAYVTGLLEKLARRRPALRARLEPVRGFLAEPLATLDALPRRLRHGDFHPLNVIWGEEGPRAVIDWEFAGHRPALWDAAVCVGCVGVEAPPGLLRGLVPAMLGVLRDRGMFDGPDRALFLELVLALRFGWLAEWLRREDRDMIELELDYMALLMANAGRLRRAWEA